ncbi:MAG: hypothetical protein GYB66_09625, partial [Chloroflexi bacterium]|nr:hypothetical protein [Chloroflexota bacterium]
MTVAQLDIIAGWAALVLTLMVFSYLIRDNFLYRIAVHILIGAAAAYAAIAAMADVIVPWLNATVLAEEGDAEAAVRALGLLPVVLALLLILKLLPRYAYIGNFTMLIVIGVGAGVALVGAVIGTIIPLIRQIGDIAETEETLNTVVVVTGT